MAGCMSFPHHDRGSKSVPILKTEGAKPSVSFRAQVQNHISTNGEAWIYDEGTVSDIVKASLEASGLFSKVRDDGGAADVNMGLTVDMYPSPNSFGVSFAAGLVMGAIPMWATSTMGVTAEIFRGKNAIGNYRLRRKNTDVVWLPLIVASPFKTIWSSKRTILKDAMTTIVVSMYEDGLLQSRPVPSSIDAVSHQSQSVEYGQQSSVVNSDVDKPLYRAPQDPNKFAVVIGVEKFAKNLPSADYAERDALAIREHLLALGYPERNMVVLTGIQATRSGFAKNLETWLPRNVNSDSEVTFFFSGHGAPDPATGKTYLVPFDGDPEYLEDSAYPIQKLRKQLEGLQAKKVIMLLDTCFSGSGARSLLAKGTRPLVTALDIPSEVGPRLAVMTASSANQVSGVLPEQAHGAFTYFYLRGLNGAAKDKEGRITLGSIYDYAMPNIEDVARRSNRGQSPQMLPGKNSDQALWIIRQ